MRERGSLTARVVNSLRFNEGGLMPSFRERYLAEVERTTNVDRETAGRFLRTVTNPEEMTAGYDRSVDDELHKVLRRIQETDTVGEAHRKTTAGIMRGRKAVREQDIASLYDPEDPMHRMLREGRALRRRLATQQRDVT